MIRTKVEIAYATEIDLNSNKSSLFEEKLY
jgi:hypothetical protein